MSMPLEFHGDSAFDSKFTSQQPCATLTDSVTVNKTLTIFGGVLDNLGHGLKSVGDKYMNLLLENANTGYAEVSIRDGLHNDKIDERIADESAYCSEHVRHCE